MGLKMSLPRSLRGQFSPLLGCLKSICNGCKRLSGEASSKSSPPIQKGWQERSCLNFHPSFANLQSCCAGLVSCVPLKRLSVLLYLPHGGLVQTWAIELTHGFMVMEERRLVCSPCSSGWWLFKLHGPLSFCVFAKTSDILLANRFFWLITHKIDVSLDWGKPGTFRNVCGERRFNGVQRSSRMRFWTHLSGSHCPHWSNCSRKHSISWTRWCRVLRQASWWKSQLGVWVQKTGFRLIDCLKLTLWTDWTTGWATSPPLSTYQGAEASCSISWGPRIKSSVNLKVQNVWKLACYDGSPSDKGGSSWEWNPLAFVKHGEIFLFSMLEECEILGALEMEQ